MTIRPADARTVRLDASDADVDDLAEVAPQIPEASSLPAGTAVVIPRWAVQRRGLLRRLLGDRRVAVARVTRCSALLVRGYVGIAAEGDDAWGVAP